MCMTSSIRLILSRRAITAKWMCRRIRMLPRPFDPSHQDGVSPPWYKNSYYLQSSKSCRFLFDLRLMTPGNSVCC
ncbi:hypothetical protein AGIG_G18426 [Arapaima gigas]